jgi:hypothetical protein
MFTTLVKLLIGIPLILAAVAIVVAIAATATAWQWLKEEMVGR